MGRPSNTIIMTVGDIILVTCIETGEQEKRRIISGGMELYSDNYGMSWWSNGVQWTPDIGPHQTAPKTHTFEVIKSAEQVRQERQKEQLMKVAQMIYDGVKSGSYSVENVAEAIMYIR